MSPDLQPKRSLPKCCHQNKRRRTSVDLHPNIPQPDSIQDAESGSEEGSDNDSDLAHSPPQTQYELMRDAGFKHLQNTDKDDYEANQKLKQRPGAMGDNMAAEGGIIESITCYNFMCHERLHVELGPLINFIVGENGSGKSAVLTALTLCLGGKASDTNRGGSLKSFVKEGQEQGSLVVRIKNAGSDAFQPEVYGQSILIERQFSRSGNSSFKVKNAQGQVISQKKEVVDNISEWYALQMGNPLMVLSQDNARQFLNSASPAQKYKYFVAGVQLEQLDNDYKLSQESLDKTLILQDDLKEQTELAKKAMEEASRLAETVNKNNSLREKARHYRNQLVWSQVVEQERELEQQNQDIAAREQRIIDLQAQCEEMSTTLNEVQDKLERLKASRADLDEEESAFKETIADAEEEWNTTKKELMLLLREERDAHGRLRTLKGEIESYESKIEEEQRRLSESAGPARSEKEQKQANALAREADLVRQIEDSTRQLPITDAKITDAENLVRVQEKQRQMKRREIMEAESRIRELQKSTGSVYDGFDRDMVQLAKAVASHPSFDSKPLGPLGAHIKLTKPEWSGILEKTFGEALNAFVVKSKKDQSILSGLIRRHNFRRPPPVYIAYGGLIDTKEQEPADDFDTILRILEFDDDLVRSQLIINNQIEKVILVPDRVEAERIMVDNGPPRNVAACICFHDGKGKRGQGLRITNRGGTIGTSPIVLSPLRPRMQSDSGRQLAVQKDNLKQLALEFRDLDLEEQHAKQALEKVKQELNAQKRGIRTLENDLRRTQADLEKFQEDLDGFEGVDARLDQLRSEVEAKRAEEQQLGRQYGNVVVEKRDLKEKTEEAKRKLSVARDDERDFSSRVAKAEGKINNCESVRRIAVSKKNQAFEKVDIEKSELARAKARCAAKKEQVEEFMTQAREVAPVRVHVPEDENHRSIEKKYDKIREQLAQREATIGASDQEIYDRAIKSKSDYDLSVRNTTNMNETIRSLKYTIAHRLQLWRNFQRQISARVRIQFNYLLSERGFRGNIDLDHRHRRVNIHVEPDETRRSAAGRNTKTLSGGEKSFSSICMLLSVWEAIGSPIRCLDEFDVFMDNVNRSISTNMLVCGLIAESTVRDLMATAVGANESKVDAARRSVSRQYILITPNAIEGRARLDKDVKIIRYAGCCVLFTITS